MKNHEKMMLELKANEEDYYLKGLISLEEKWKREEAILKRRSR